MKNLILKEITLLKKLNKNSWKPFKKKMLKDPINWFKKLEKLSITPLDLKNTNLSNFLNQPEITKLINLNKLKNKKF